MKCVLPVPLGPITPIRSPNQTSASNGPTIPAIDSPLSRSATLPVRPPSIRIRTFCTSALSGGFSRSSNRSSRCCADRAFEAQLSLYADLRRISFTMSVSRRCSSS